MRHFDLSNFSPKCHTSNKYKCTINENNEIGTIWPLEQMVDEYMAIFNTFKCKSKIKKLSKCPTSNKYKCTINKNN